MGYWGSGLYANDTGMDVRDTYMDLLQDGMDDETAWNTMLKKFSEYINTDEEALFWYAAADTQWRLGRLRPEVRDKAMMWLARQGGLELWADSTSKGKGWIKTMQTLEKRLQSSMPAYKKVTKPVVPEQDPWELNDIYAYQFRSEFSKWNGTYGKYALLQKIGTQRITYFNKLGMVVQIFDKYFDTLPTVDDIWKYRILPFDLPNRVDIFEDSRDSDGVLIKRRPVLMNALMETLSVRGYPKSSLIYIGNQPGPANYRQDPWTVTWRDFERIFCMQHMRWDGLAYDTVDEGIYEFNPKADPEHFCRHLQKIEQRKQQCKSCPKSGICWSGFQSK